ncbi:MAG: IS481 family transposase [Proteobacteria bacterium]|nr:IS481 family transposase [Pseudomonadota bacterium]
MLGRLEAGQHQLDVAQAMGISLTTLKKWLRRYRGEGVAGLQDRSSRPRRSPRRLDSTVATRIILLRHRRRSGRFICRQLGVSAASVSRILRRAHLSRWRELEPHPPVQRYEREQPGELLHLDTKKLGRITRIGHRITGDRSGSFGKAGWEFVHVAIDDHSRVALASVAADEKGNTATAFLKAAVAHFQERGVRIQRVMTDNGSAYLSDTFKHACQQLRIRHVRTKPYTPRTNGKAERFIQTCLREWAYAEPYRSSAARTIALEHWLHHYNWHRPHSALQSNPPISRLNLDGHNLLRLHT